MVVPSGRSADVRLIRGMMYISNLFLLLIPENKCVKPLLLHSICHPCVGVCIQIILQDLEDSVIDEPPACPHAEHIQGIARRQRERIAGLEADLHREAHNKSNIEEINEDLYERVSGLSSYNCHVVNDLETMRSVAAAKGDSALKYKCGFWIVTSILIMCFAHMMFFSTN